jgi:DnaJ-class molecular chaperone
MDHYSTLGVNKNATPDEIKKAYRSLASKHHPDKGGDTAKFQEIQTAYATLSDPDKRAEYDNPSPFGTRADGGWQQAGGFPPGFEDIFAHFGGGGNPFGNMFGGGRPHVHRNRTLNIQTTISLEEAFHGKDLIATVGLPSGREQVIEIKIPSGVQDGTVLRLSQMGDDSIPNIPRGDIHLTINIHNHAKFQRQGDDLICGLTINCFDAIIGKTVQLETLDGKTLEVLIKPGTQHGQLMAAAGYGMPKMNDNRFKGRLLISINISIPTDLSEVKKQILRENFQ